MQPLAYQEGDWFALPVEGGHVATGIIARAAPRGRILFGYFYRPDGVRVPDLVELISRKPEHAALIARFGDRGFVDGSWTVIGRQPQWNRAEWPMPAFGHEDQITGRFTGRSYPGDDPSGRFKESRISASRYRELPRDGLYGSVAIQRVLAVR